MKRFSNSFWLVEVPLIAAYIHLVGGCALTGIFPSIRLDGVAKELLENILFWPGMLFFWIFGRASDLSSIGELLSFLWAPGLAFWVTRIILKRKDAK